MAVAIGGEPAHQLVVVRPWVTAQQWAQRHEPRDRLCRRRRGWDVEGSEARNICRRDRNERHTESKCRVWKLRLGALSSGGITKLPITSIGASIASTAPMNPPAHCHASSGVAKGPVTRVKP